MQDAIRGAVRAWMALLAGLCGVAGAAGGGLDRQAKQWVPVEWSLENPGFKGEAFEAAATVTFRHVDSGETRTTGMFYAGGATWRFRFTATRPGRWTFSTASKAGSLHGRRGVVTVEALRAGRKKRKSRSGVWKRGGRSGQDVSLGDEERRGGGAPPATLSCGKASNRLY